jgi:hypothetical protein
MGATGDFSLPAQAPPSTQGPSEYTRMMQAYNSPPSSSPAGVPAQSPQMQMPQVQGPQLNFQPPNLQMQPPSVSAQPPQMQIPPIQMQAPPMQAPQMPAGGTAAPQTNWLLIAIIGLLCFLVGGVIVYLLVRR